MSKYGATLGLIRNRWCMIADVKVRAVRFATASTRGAEPPLRGWGLAAFGVAMLLGGIGFIPIVRARDADGIPKFIPQGSETFKLVLSVFLAVAGVVMVVIGVIQGV